MSGRYAISAEAMVPCGYRRQGFLPPLDCRIAHRGLSCLLGPAGREKVQYLRVLAGMEAPRRGEVRFCSRAGEDLRELEWQAFRRQVGFVMRQTPLLSVLDGMSNVMLPGLYHQLGDRDEIARRAREIVGGIKYGADHRILPAYMSGMQRHHLALARALMLAPEVLVVDQPFYGLEVGAANLIADYLLWARVQFDLTLLISTRNLWFVSQHADQVIFIGEETVEVFDSWRALLASGAGEVQRYLELERQACHAFEAEPL